MKSPQSTVSHPGGATSRTKSTINAVAAGMVLVGVIGLMLAFRPNTDVDLGLHLAIGRLVANDGPIPIELPGLTVLADTSYVATQWLAELVGYLVWSGLGLTGILLLRLLCLFILVTALAWACRSVGPLTPALVATTFGVFGSAMAWGERPQVAGLAAFAVTSALLWRSADRPILSALVVPLVWFWAMLHGTWTLGLALVGIFALGAAFDGNRRRAVTLATQAVLALLAAALTPLGLAAITTPLQVAGAARAEVNEWANPALTNPFLIAVLLAAAGIVGSWRRNRPSFTHLLIWLFALLCAVSMVRLVAFGAVALAPLVALALAHHSPAPAAQLEPRAERTLWYALGVVGIVITGLVTALAPPSLPLSGPMTAALHQMPAGTRIAVEPRLSGWVLWAHPDLRVLKDLRAEAYSPRTTKAYSAFQDADSGWMEYARTTGIDAILVDTGEPLAEALPESRDWRWVLEDAGTELWVKR